MEQRDCGGGTQRSRRASYARGSCSSDEAHHLQEPPQRMAVLDKQMHQTMLQMCAAPICAAHHTSQVQILASVPGSCMWDA